VIPPPLQLPAACSPCFESTAPRRLLWARFNGPRITPSIISCVVAELQNPGGQGSKGEVTLFQSSRRRHACRKHDWVRIWGSGLWELQGCGLVSPPARAAVAVTGGCGRVAWYASALSTPNKSQPHSRDAAARLIPLFGCWSPAGPRPTPPHEGKVQSRPQPSWRRAIAEHITIIASSVVTIMCRLPTLAAPLPIFR